MSEFGSVGQRWGVGGARGETIPEAVTVDAEGVASAQAIGQATFEALFETHSASLVVEVLPPGPLIFLDNFESGDLTWWSASVP